MEEDTLLPVNNYYHSLCHGGKEVYLIAYHEKYAVVYAKEYDEYDTVLPHQLSPIKTDKQKFVEQVNDRLFKEDVSLKDIVEFLWDNGYGKLP